jgi:hypothetical protein
MWDERIANTLEDFVREVADMVPTSAPSDVAFWFRGQSNAAWHLEPSFLRSFRHLGESTAAALRLEEDALKAFRSQAHLFVQPFLLEKVKTTACWWALMQHHRAPTRLLDWTVSPYVAAYFAAERGEIEADGAVWCFCSHLLRARFEQVHGTIPDAEEPGAPEWYKDKLTALRDQPVVMPLTFNFASSERMVAQQGRFTMSFRVHGHQDCIVESVGRERARKIMIPHRSKREFLLRLREMNITGASLFPGVDGLGRSIGELISLGDQAIPDARPHDSATGSHALGKRQTW